MDVSFDSEKRASTLAERGLDFADALTLLAGPALTLEDDRFAYPEPRYQSYGRLAERLVLMGLDADRDGDPRDFNEALP